MGTKYPAPVRRSDRAWTFGFVAAHHALGKPAFGAR
jgi:hypothetical protein